MKWLPKQDEELIKLHAEGVTFNMIAQLLNEKFKTNFKRNSIAGRAFRLNLPKREYEKKDKILPEPKEKIVRIKEEKPPKYDFSGWHPSESGDIGIMDLTEYTCRFPKGDKPVTFCGKPKDIDSPYCLYHHHVCYRDTQAQKRATEVF